jgi:hypothetical protein
MTKSELISAIADAPDDALVSIQDARGLRESYERQGRRGRPESTGPLVYLPGMG